VLAVGTSVTEVSTTITNVKIGQTGFAFLVDDQGKVIAHPSTRDSLKAHPAVAGLGAEPRKQIVFTNPSGKLVIAFAEKTRYGWTLVAQQDYDEAFGPLALANRNALILLGVTVLFVVLVSYALAGG
jgi:methyl-accepting chemotaxis protein